jgi:hypothetical protein
VLHEADCAAQLIDQNHAHVAHREPQLLPVLLDSLFLALTLQLFLVTPLLLHNAIQCTSERGVCGGPLAFHYANLMSHTAFRQSLACVSLLFLHSAIGSTVQHLRSLCHILHSVSHWPVLVYYFNTSDHSPNANITCCAKCPCQLSTSHAVPSVLVNCHACQLAGRQMMAEHTQPLELCGAAAHLLLLHLGCHVRIKVGTLHCAGVSGQLEVLWHSQWCIALMDQKRPTSRDWSCLQS